MYDLFTNAIIAKERLKRKMAISKRIKMLSSVFAGKSFNLMF